MSSDEDLSCFYYFYEHNTGKKYYYNPTSQSTFWVLPKGSIIVNPTTMEVVDDIKQTMFNNINRAHGRTATVISVMHPRKIKTSFDGVQRMANQTSKLATKFYIPDSLEDDASTNPINMLFENIFLTIKMKSVNSYTFQDTPIQRSLLPQEKNVEKNAYNLFKSILKFTDVRASKECGGTAELIVDAVRKNNNSLVDEVYVQLIKQTNECPEKYLKKTLDIILVIVNIFMPADNILKCMKSQLARISKSAESDDNKKLAIWCYIALQKRVDMGVPFDVDSMKPDELLKYLKDIPNQINMTKKRFGCSLHEIMFYQHSECPNMPIPLLMHKLAECLFEHNCERSQGIFRLPGNMAKVDTFIERINNGEFDFLKNETLDDIASLFKLWIRQLHGSIVNSALTAELLTIKGGENFQNFSKKLDTLHKNVLMYLVGFLKRLALSSQDTMMDVANLAMVYGPNVVLSVDNDPRYQTKLATHSTNFLKELINKLDVSYIYPLSC